MWQIPALPIPPCSPTGPAGPGEEPGKEIPPHQRFSCGASALAGGPCSGPDPRPGVGAEGILTSPWESMWLCCGLVLFPVASICSDAETVLAL